MMFLNNYSRDLSHRGRAVPSLPQRGKPAPPGICRRKLRRQTFTVCDAGHRYRDAWVPHACGMTMLWNKCQITLGHATALAYCATTIPSCSLYSQYTPSPTKGNLLSAMKMNCFTDTSICGTPEQRTPETGGGPGVARAVVRTVGRTVGDGGRVPKHPTRRRKYRIRHFAIAIRRSRQW